MKPTLLYAGSFDPPTFAHLDMIKRASILCGKLYVCIAINPNKPRFLIPALKRKELLQNLLQNYKQVEVILYEGLLVTIAKEKKVDFFLRGIRTVNDFESEYAMSTANRDLSGIDTLFLLSKPEFKHFSSTLVHEIHQFNGPLDHLVPPSVVDWLNNAS